MTYVQHGIHYDMEDFEIMTYMIQIPFYEGGVRDRDINICTAGALTDKLPE
jgi:hypothetical protein